MDFNDPGKIHPELVTFILFYSAVIAKIFYSVIAKILYSVFKLLITI